MPGLIARIGRRIVSVTSFLTVVVLIGVIAPAAGQQVDHSGGSWQPSDSSSSGDGSSGGGNTGGTGSTGYYAWELEFVPLPGSLPGEPGEENGCWGITTVGGPRSSPAPAGQSYETAVDEANYYGGNGTLWDLCPAEQAFDIVAYVNDYWQTVVRPPPPTPLNVDPGRMITGLTAYLEIGGDPAPIYTLDNPIGADITITATPRYVVGWGDGATAETTSQGVPYPGGAGEVTHVYTEDGDLTVTVEAYWRGEWSAGGEGGSLAELPVPTTASLALPVDQAQATTD